MSEDAAIMALNLARNCGYHVFPCLENKRPATPHGFKDASADPAIIAGLWHRYQGSLIGIATGELSGISVLDIDIKHDEARAWWHKYQRHIPITRSYRTRSGGVHLYFQHMPGIVNSEGRPVKGVDVRGQGGFVISWWCAGLECLDHSPAAGWPKWLKHAIWPTPKPMSSIASRQGPLSEETLERIRTRAIQRVRETGGGGIHNALRSNARLLGGIQVRAKFSDEQAIGWLLDAANLRNERKAANTVLWGLARGRSEPLPEVAAWK